MKPKLIQHSCDHTCKYFSILGVVAVLKLCHQFNRVFNRYFFSINSLKVDISGIFNVLILTFCWSSKTWKELTDVLICLLHSQFVSWSQFFRGRDQQAFKDDSKQSQIQLSLFQNAFIAVLGIELGLATVFLIKIENRGYNLFLNIGKECGNKRISNCSDSLGYPLVKVKEFSFTCQNSKTD